MYHQGPVELRNRRLCQVIAAVRNPMGQQSTGSPSFRSCPILPGNPGHASPAVPQCSDQPQHSPQYPLIDCRRLSTRPTPWHDLSRSPPRGSPRRRRREPRVAAGGLRPGTRQVPIHIPKGGNDMRPYRFQPYRRADPART